MDRRAFLGSVAATAAAGALKIDAQEQRPIPIIDTHIHLFDPNRPQGAPYLVGVFGEDRILFGSDWPNSDGVAPVENVFAVVKDYFMGKPRSVQEKYFWKNSVAAYRWVKREPEQPS